MPSVQVDFGKGSFPAMDESTLDGPISPYAVDLYEDELGARFKRPGLARLGSQNVGVPVQGSYWSETFQAFFVVGGGRVYKISLDGTVFLCTGPIFETDQRATFTENGTYVFITAGSVTLQCNSSTVVQVTDPLWASIITTHLIWVDGHVLFNQKGSNYFWWTDVNSTTANSDNSEAANADLDHIVAMDYLLREVYLFGTRSTEIWFNTGETPGTFQRLEGAFIGRGCSAPYSIVKANSTIFWLDHERSFICLEGRNPKVVSQPIAKVLRDLPSVEDMVANHFQFGNRRFISLSSVSNNLTLIYDYVLDRWYQWGIWDSTKNSYNMWSLNSVAFSPANGMYLIAGNDGLLYLLSETAADARFFLRSSHLSFGTYKWKILPEMLIRAKRGFVTDSSTPQLWFRMRKNGDKWSNEHYISVNSRGQYKNVEHVHRLGHCRTIQLEFVQSDPTPFALVGVEMGVEEKDDR